MDSLQFSADPPFTISPFDAQHVGFAADLAIFDVFLLAPAAGVDGGLVPFAAAGALISGWLGLVVHRFVFSTRGECVPKFLLQPTRLVARPIE